MSYVQTVTPNPHIPCKPGWCLQYVRQAYGLPARHPTATAAWEASTSKHRDRNFPAGVWIPVWYALANEPAGHVVLRAPDGSVFSTSSLKNTPYHHPDLADLERFYAKYGMKLTYRGWTEDVAGYQVIAPRGITAQSTTLEEDDMPSAKDVAAETVALLLAHPVDRQGPGMTGTVTLAAILAWYDANNAAIPSNVWSYRNPSGEEARDAYQILRDADADTIVANIPDSIAQDVIDALSARLSQ